ncbi:hypothetical protein T4C_8054, partial [Trichinella pseudospiralis]
MRCFGLWIGVIHRTIPNLMIPIKVIMNSRFAWNLIGLNVSGSPHQKSMNRVSISFNPSKIGCISPMIIALFGPSRRWLMPMYCRSIRVTKATDRRIVMVMASRLVAHILIYYELKFRCDNNSPED